MIPNAFPPFASPHVSNSRLRAKRVALDSTFRARARLFAPFPSPANRRWSSIKHSRTSPETTAEMARNMSAKTNVCGAESSTPSFASCRAFFARALQRVEQYTCLRSGNGSSQLSAWQRSNSLMRRRRFVHDRSGLYVHSSPHEPHSQDRLQGEARRVRPRSREYPREASTNDRTEPLPKPREGPAPSSEPLAMRSILRRLNVSPTRHPTCHRERFADARLARPVARFARGVMRATAFQRLLFKGDAGAKYDRW